jgi:hypothetical protein
MHGYIDKTGEIVFKLQCEMCAEFSEGLARVQYKDHRVSTWEFGYISKTGKQVIEPQAYYNAEDFCEGLARVCIRVAPNSVLYGFINKKGEMEIQAEYKDVYNFKEGMARVKVDHCFYINKKGKVVIKLKPEFYTAYNFSEGLARITNGKYGYIDQNGNMKIKPQFDFAHDFIDGIAGASIDNKWGFIDTNGEFIIKPEYDLYTSSFSEGMAKVVMDGKAYFINLEGERLFSLENTYGSDFREGLAKASKYNKWGYIDKTGTWVVEPQYDSANWFSDGLGMVYKKKNGWSYLDSTGNVVLEFEKKNYYNMQSFKEGLAGFKKKDD